MSGTDFTSALPIAKAHRGLGIVFGWAIACNVDGKPYLDLQKHHIPEKSMLEEAAVFMEGDRVGGEQHRKEIQPDGSEEIIKRGKVVFAFPLTTEIAKAMGVQTRVTGLMVGWKPNEDCREEILAKVESGKYTGFSIGGKVYKTRPMQMED